MLEFRIRGLAEAKSRMGARRRRLRNTRGAHLKAAVLVEEWTLRNMQREGSLHEDGAFRWPDLKPSTKRQRAKLGKWPGRILQVTGRLRGAFETSATNRRGRVRNRVHYARSHEDGTRRMPQRKIFPTPQQGRKIALPAYEHHVRNALQGV